jgi:biotin transport system permease protein
MLTLTSPVDTWLHRLPAGLKLLVLLLATVLMVRIGNPAWLTGLLIAVAGFYRCFGPIFFRHGVRLLKPLLPFAVIVALWHGWIGDWIGGAVIIEHFVLAVAIANLVTMTTRLTDMIAVVERLTPDIAWLGLSPRKLALAIALTIRFVPVLGQKIEQIGLAFKARSVKRPRWRILVPTVLAVLDDADHVADALKARGGVDR